MPHPQNTPADFHAKVRRTEPATCWPFQGAILDSGYGTFKLAGVTWRAHRLAYVLANGPIPDGMAVCHSCDNRRCCNPAHLWIGSNADNQADMTAKGRGRMGNRNGMHTQPGHTKLTANQIRAIRQRDAAGWPQRLSAREFGVSQTQISKIVRRVSWSHIA